MTVILITTFIISNKSVFPRSNRKDLKTIIIIIIIIITIIIKIFEDQYMDSVCLYYCNTVDKYYTL